MKASLKPHYEKYKAAEFEVFLIWKSENSVYITRQSIVFRLLKVAKVK